MVLEVSLCKSTPKEFNEQAIKDIIDIFYKGPDCNLLVTSSEEEDYGSARGIFVPGKDKNTITLFHNNIILSFSEKRPVGGNKTIPDDMIIAYAFVFRHELQHLNQCVMSGDTYTKDNLIRAGKYRGKPCEVDARASVDASQNILREMFGVKSMNYNIIETTNKIQNIIASINKNIKRCDVISILKKEGLNSPHNLMHIFSSLKEKGLSVM